jgi:hypothetical protein
MKRFALFFIISVIILNIRIVWQPQYDHYVLGINSSETAITFSSEGIHSVWLHGIGFIPDKNGWREMTQFEYDNI